MSTNDSPHRRLRRGVSAARQYRNNLPGAGDSSIPTGGYDKATTAKRIHDGVRGLGFTQVSILSYDTGTLVAHPYARDYPNEVVRLIAMDIPLSGFGLENYYGLSFHLGLDRRGEPGAA